MMSDSYLVELFFLVSVVCFLVALFIVIPVLYTYNKLTTEEKEKLEKWKKLSKEIDAVDTSRKLSKKPN